jgi:hypothetical protein
MPIRELPIHEQISILKQLAENEKEYDKNVTLAKGDSYTLKYKYNIDTDLNPISLIQESLKQQPTIQAIQKLTPSTFSKSKKKKDNIETKKDKTTMNPNDASVNTDPEMPSLLHMEESSNNNVPNNPFSTQIPAIASSTPNVKPLFSLGVNKAVKVISPTKNPLSRSKLVTAPAPNRASSIPDNSDATTATTDSAEPTLAPVKEETNENSHDNINLFIIKKHGFPTPNEIKSFNDADTIISNISDYNKRKMAPRLAALSRQGLKESEEYQTMQNDCRELVKYKRFLQENNYESDESEQLGSGLLKIGKFYAYREHLGNGSLKLRHKNKSKIKNIPDQNISEGVKQLLLKRYNPKFPYTDSDYRKYQEICFKTGLKCKPHSQKVNIWFSNLRDIQKRFLEIIGEIKAGNNNVELKNELSGISDILFNNNKITGDEYKSIQHLVVNK